MRIGILWENFEYGGVTTHLENLLNDKIFRKTEFVIFTNKTNKARFILKKKIKSKNCKFYYYNSLNVIYFNNKFMKLLYFSIRPLLFIISIFQFHNILKKFKFDILLAECGGYGDFRSELSGLLASNFLKFPVRILLIHHSFTKPLFWNLFLRVIDNLVKKSIDSLIFVSDATKRNIIERTNLSNKKIKEKIIYNGVDINYSHNKKKLLNKIFKHKKVLKIGMLSRIEQNKGQELLIDAIAELPNRIRNRMIIYFMGFSKKKYLLELKRKVKGLRLEKYFIFTGYINVKSRTILKKINLLISLTKDFEGFGLSLAEALSVKTPVLSTKVGGVTEFLNKKNSKLIKPNNKKELKDALYDFANNTQKWKKRAINGNKQIKKNFSSKIMATKYKNFFNSLLNK